MDWLSASKHSSECVNYVANAVNLHEVCKNFLVEGAADSPEFRPNKGWFDMVMIRVRVHVVELAE